MDNTSNNENKHSFLRGAMVLGASMVIVKLIGMVFKIVLSRMFGGVGTGIFNTAYELYNPLFTLATAGFPIAISRLVSENITRKRYNDVKLIHKISVPIFIITGIICFTIMVFGSFIYINIIKAPEAIYAILFLSPTIFFGCLMSIYRGYFEGTRNMVPTAISEVIEASSKLIIGVSASYLTIFFALKEFDKNGTVLGKAYENAEQARDAIIPLAVGISILGISLGAFFGFIFLLIRYKVKGSGITKEQYAAAPAPVPTKQMVKTLIKTALPIGAGSIIMSLASTIDVTLINMRLYSVMQTSPDELLSVYNSLIPQSVIDNGQVHIFLFGCYGMALTLMMIVPAVTQVFGTSALPSVTAAWTNGDKKILKARMESVLRVTIPAGLGLAVFSQPIMNLLYGNSSVVSEVEIAARVLCVMGIAVIFTSTSTPICSMLQAVGRVDVPLKLLSIGVIIKIILNYTLVGIPKINIQGASVGTLVCYIFVTIVGLCILCKETKIIPDFYNILIKPMCSAVICILLSYGFYRLLLLVMDNKFTILLVIIFAVISYAVTLIVMKTITKEDLARMPMGNKIVKVLEKRKLIR